MKREIQDNFFLKRQNYEELIFMSLEVSQDEFVNLPDFSDFPDQTTFHFPDL